MNKFNLKFTIVSILGILVLFLLFYFTWDVSKLYFILTVTLLGILLIAYLILPKKYFEKLADWIEEILMHMP